MQYKPLDLFKLRRFLLDIALLFRQRSAAERTHPPFVWLEYPKAFRALYRLDRVFFTALSFFAAGFLLERPFAVVVGHTKPRVITGMVEDYRPLARLISHTAHRLLYVKRQRLCRAEQYRAAAVRHIKALGDQIHIAQHLYPPGAKVVDYFRPLRLWRFAVDMPSRDSGGIKRFGDRSRVLDRRAVTYGFLPAAQPRVM